MSAANSDESLQGICCGDESAMQFCRIFLHWVHWIDDLVDKDKEWTPERVIRINLDAATVFSDNEFFQRHKNQLAPVILSAARAFGDSIEFSKRKSRRDRRTADVLKSSYHEIFWQTAFLCAVQQGRDGWQHMANVTRKFREFNYDFKG